MLGYSETRPGDDPQLDDAVAKLRALNGTTSGDPLSA
jgi:hypothetical protein